jgi:hypothetical protein
MKSIFTTLGRILIILTVAGLIVAGLSLLTGSTGSATSMQPPAFDGNLATGTADIRPEGHDGGGSAFGLLELVKNVGVIGLIITAYWFLQNGLNQFKRKSRLAI